MTTKQLIQIQIIELVMQSATCSDDELQFITLKLNFLRKITG
jgi:hypothetical protein